MNARDFYNEFVNDTREEFVWDSETGKGQSYREIYKTDEPAYTELVHKLPFRNCVPMENELINIHCKQQTYIL